MKKHMLKIDSIRMQYVTIYMVWGVFLMVLVSPANAYEFPPYEGLTFKITGNLSENYSNNITYAKENENRVEQFTTMMAFGFDVNYEGKRGALGLGGQMRQPIRFDDSDVRNSSELFTLNILNEFSQDDRIRMNNVFTHTKVPGSFQESTFDEECEKLLIESGIDAVRNDPRCSQFSREFGRSQGDFDIYENNFNLNYTKDFSDKIFATAYYANNMYDSSEESSNDSIRNSINVSVNYKLSYATTFYLSYRYSDTNYDERDHISIDSVRTGINQYITKRLVFRGNIGMVFAPSTESTSFDASLSGEIDEKTNASIDFSRDIRTAVDREDVFRHWQIRGNLGRALSEDMSGSISGFYGEGDFVSEDVTEKLVGATISLNYNFWQHKRGARIRGTLGYTYSMLDSTDENSGYNRNSVNSGLTVAF